MLRSAVISAYCHMYCFILSPFNVEWNIIQYMLLLFAAWFILGF